MFKDASIFSFISSRRGDILAPGNLSQERDAWKGNVETMELKCLNLQEDLVTLHGGG